MIKITKKNRPIIIVYSNPNTLINRIKRFFLIRKKKGKKLLYFYCHPLSWWLQFEKKAEVKIFIWRSLSSQHQKVIFPDNKIGELMFDILYFLESRFSSFFAKNFQYPIIILKKK